MIGAIIGGILAGFLADMIGPQITIFISALVLIPGIFFYYKIRIKKGILHKGDYYIKLFNF